MTRIITLSGLPHPQARIDTINAGEGICTFTFLTVGGVPADSGGSVARFEPPLPLQPEDFVAPAIYPEIPDETLSAAIVAVVNAPAPTPTAAQIYAEQQSLGYLDATTGLKLKTTEHAQAKFTSQVALVQLALSAAVITPATPQTIWDFADAEQELSTADFLGLMLRYGLHCKTLFDEYAP